MPRWSEETPNELWDRFFEKVRENGDGCLVWRKGSPRMWFQGKPRLPQHVHYFIAHGSLPGASMVRQCNNPRCCNAAHFKLGNDPNIVTKRLSLLKLSRDMLDWEIERLQSLVDTSVHSCS
jgi:hypothetical protein